MHRAENFAHRPADPFARRTAGFTIPLNLRASRARNDDNRNQRRKCEDRNPQIDPEHDRHGYDGEHDDRNLIDRPTQRVFDHFGIDFLGLTRAISENLRANSVVQGGSTITQQLAKNLFLTNERSLDRKIKEAFLALWLEANLTKKEILGIGIQDYLTGSGEIAPGIVLIEWAERFPEIWPKNRLEIHIDFQQKAENRRIEMLAYGDRFEGVLGRLKSR